MTHTGEQITVDGLSDEEWFETILNRLDICLNNEDVLGRLRIIREAKNARPKLIAWFVGIEFMCPHVDGAMAARKVALEIAAKAKVTNTVTMTVNGDVKVEDGGVVGVDGSSDKATGGSNGQPK